MIRCVLKWGGTPQRKATGLQQMLTIQLALPFAFHNRSARALASVMDSVTSMMSQCIQTYTLRDSVLTLSMILLVSKNTSVALNLDTITIFEPMITRMTALTTLA